MSYIEETEEYIMSLAKNMRCDIEDSFDSKWVQSSIDDYPPHVREMLDHAFKSLIDQGVFDDNGWLTELGYRKLYS